MLAGRSQRSVVLPPLSAARPLTRTGASADCARSMGLSTSPLHLRVFLASPADVEDERAVAVRVLTDLPYDPFLRAQVTIEVVAWDLPRPGVPMLATMTPQAAVAQGVPKPSQCDVVVVIFWSRMGTPLPSDYLKADGTPYLSGTEWEYLDALEATRRTGQPEIIVYRRSEDPSLKQSDPDFDEKRRQWLLVDKFFAAFRAPDGSMRRGYNEYEKPEDFRSQLDRHLKSIIRLRLEGRAAPARPPESTAPATAPPLWKGAPFPGLRAFTPDDAPIFFGRGRETDDLLRALADTSTRLVVVVGASGSGKSSLIAAGLLPRLSANAIEGSKDWLLPHVAPAAGDRKQWAALQFTPGELGDNPFVALAAKLVPLLPDESTTPRAAAERLAAEPEALQELVERVLRGRQPWAELVLFADQLEELFTVVAEHWWEPFVNLLAAAVQTPRMRTVATLRADFYHRCLDWPALAAILRSGTFPLAVPEMPALFHMVSDPAARAGLEFDEGLCDLILRDTGTDPGALALLAFALHELYEARTPHGRLTRAAYDAFDGVRGAISRRAENTFAGLSGAVQNQLGGVFRELVEVNVRGLATRRRVARERLVASGDAERLVDAFTDARLLVTDRGPDGKAMVEVAHEALLGEWRRLANWVSDFADDLHDCRQIEAAAAEWQRSGRDPSHLWPNERLVSAERALERLGLQRPALSEPVKSFVRPEAERLLEELELAETTHYRRAEIGDRLDRIGDPRPGVGLLPSGVPDIVWCEVPGGTVTLEEIEGTFEVEPFLIAKYPVTYRQYRAFLDDPEGTATRAGGKA